MNSSGKWLVGRRAPEARLRLICLPFAGGSAATYLPWQAALGPTVEVCAVQLPGRGARVAEPPISSLHQIIGTLAHIIASDTALPFALFGHSMGALLGFELARQCARLGLSMPVHLFASGCAAPQRRDPTKALHRLPDDELIAALADYNGTPPELLAHRELMAILLPMLRADFSVVGNYEYQHAPLLNVPITVLAGKDDQRVTLEQAAAWSLESSVPSHIEWFDGDHFFIQQHTQAVLDCVRRHLAPESRVYRELKT
jgi:medium-chain acyl-[acyl-carrier-protein] hydrolase